MMFLAQFLIGNLWSAGLICMMLGLKWLLRNRLSLRFHYFSWYILLISLFLSLLPVGIWPQWGFTGSAGWQAFAVSPAAGSSSPAAAVGDGWLQDTTELLRSPDNDWFAFLVLIIWAAGVLVLAGVYWRGSRQLRRIKRYSSEPSQIIRERFEACRRRLGMKANAQLRQSRFLTAPVSFGGIRPFVVLPMEGTDDLPPEALDHVFLHELTHIRHGDLITNSLFCGVQALFWCNPLVWLALRQMRRDREAYCDWAVLNCLPDDSDRTRYGQTILRFAAGSNTHFSAANGLCQRKEMLKYRLEQIVCFRRETKGRRFLGHCFALSLALAAIGQIPLLAYCAENNEAYYTPSDPLMMAEADWGNAFEGKDGCAVVYDLNTGLYTVYNKPEVTRRVPPCSTYKIYSALNALEQGIITPEANTICWDGTAYGFEAWNRDQTLRSAMGESVNWYFAALDQAAGMAQLEAFFREIGYGDGSLGDDPDSYWNGSGVKISALEQVELLVKLYRNDFGFTDKNIAAVKDSMALNEEGLYGKTGTGRLDGKNIAGWFIGFAEKPDNTYLFAVYLSPENGADGRMAYETAIRILENLHIIK